jgi:hypothetical protein
MCYLLDTNIVSEMIRNPQGRVTERIRAVGEASVASTCGRFQTTVPTMPNTMPNLWHRRFVTDLSARAANPCRGRTCHNRSQRL